MNNDAQLRPCTAKIYKNGKWENITGLFHSWSIDFEEFDGGPGNYPVAIIELADGKVVTCMADSVVFLDRNVETENDNNRTPKENGVWIVHDHLFSKWVECGNCGFQIPLRNKEDLEKVVHTDKCPLCQIPIVEYRDSETNIKLRR